MNKPVIRFIRSVWVVLFSALAPGTQAEDGYHLWLRYNRISDEALLNAYRRQIQVICAGRPSPTLDAAGKELQIALSGLLQKPVPLTQQVRQPGTLVFGTAASSQVVASLNLKEELLQAGEEGFVIQSVYYRKKRITVIAANREQGVLYGVFHFIRMLQTHQDISNLNFITSPKIKLRLLNHWDNLDRTVERGYAGFSIWDWHKLPDFIDRRYTDYARANASIGVNGTVLTNVNANAHVLTPQYLQKAAALANVFRPYGIRVYLTARFSAPVEIGGLKTADPLEPEVQQWWNNKVREIYSLIPDFGGFLVKANSEGQPGPQNYGRTHADGANMLARALAPFNGVVMWARFCVQ
ncbi:MAG: hypothetical protein KatS3mg032_2103 [Cyclobacteriaceae bacterium]|nr:MAG: hypothetical protein KatS3mg032_2103 [Cyclobacteriaceae bacterium]